MTDVKPNERERALAETVRLTPISDAGRYTSQRLVRAPTLADAYAALTGGSDD